MELSELIRQAKTDKKTYYVTMKSCQLDAHSSSAFSLLLVIGVLELLIELAEYILAKETK